MATQSKHNAMTKNCIKITNEFIESQKLKSGQNKMSETIIETLHCTKCGHHFTKEIPQTQR